MKQSKLKRQSTLLVARSAVFCAMYVALTYAFMPLAYGAFQIRPSEGLTLLPLLYPEAVPALWIGCMLGNVGSPTGAWDVTVGGAITLVAALLTRLCHRIKPRALGVVLGGLPPVLLNAFGLPLLWHLLGAEVLYWPNVGSIALTQAVFVYAVGVPLVLLCDRLCRKGVGAFLPVSKLPREQKAVEPICKAQTEVAPYCDGQEEHREARGEQNIGD